MPALRYRTSSGGVNGRAPGWASATIGVITVAANNSDSARAGVFMVVNLLGTDRGERAIERHDRADSSDASDVNIDRRRTRESAVHGRPHTTWRPTFSARLAPAAARIDVRCSALMTSRREPQARLRFIRQNPAIACLC